MKNALHLRFVSNDLRKQPGVTIALAVLLILSAFLMATGSMVMERLIGSVDQLFEETKPPHFLQMHTGGYDRDALDGFASEHPEIQAWLIEDLLGFDSAAIAWNRPSTGESGDLAGSLIDNLFVTQNREFDFLLDESGAIPHPANGEVYAPVAYQQRFGLHTGDRLRIATGTGAHELRIRGFVRDSQMASSLSSATRFLISDADFRELRRAGGGAPEIIVEYRLTSLSSVPGFQRAYESDETLPKNGQAVTFEMIRMINAFSDGLVAVALMLLSLLLIAIALFSLRFVIRGTLEEQIHEIGAMKAIGLPSTTIAGLYLAKYRVMTLLACVIGGGMAVVAAQLLTQSIQVHYAEAPPGAATFLVPVLALALLFLFVVAICRSVLRAVARIDVVGALVHGSILGERQTARRAKRLATRGPLAVRGSLAARAVRATRPPRSRLATARGGTAVGGIGVSGRLVLLDLWAERGQWALIPIVFCFATVLMTLPMNLLSTFESPRFVTNMGAPESALRADLQFSDDLEAEHDGLLSSMLNDDRLTEVRSFTKLLYEASGDDGWETLRVEMGDSPGGTVEFLRGGPPQAGQIALSVLNADKYRVSPGDELAIRVGGEPSTVVVSGIYQDVTSGGYTAKMHGTAAAGAVGYVIYANMAGGSDPAAVAADYGERFPTVGVIPMREYVKQTLSYVTGAFRSAAVLSCVFGIGVAALITSLFLALRLTRDRRKMGVLAAIGFSSGELIAQVRIKTLLAVIAGTALGLVVAATAGESFVGFCIASADLGIAKLTFVPNPVLVYAAYPLLLIGAGYLGAVVLTARLRGTDKSSWLR